MGRGLAIERSVSVMLKTSSFLARVFGSLFLCLAFGKSLAADLPASIDIVTEEFPPFNYTDKGRLTGYATEVVEAVLAEAGVKGTFHMVPWARAMNWAQGKENVLIFSIARNEERENKFKFVGQITEGENYFYALKARNIELSSLESAKKFVVGVVHDDIKEAMLIKQGFELNKNLISVQSSEQNYRKLKTGRIDLWPMNSVTMRYVVRQSGDEPDWTIEPVLKIDSIFLYPGDFMAFGLKTSDAVVEAFRQALDRVKASGKFKEISAKWEH
jgi:polar amino acid transport system substrate-binding protein